MICSLLLLYARDSDHIKNDLLNQLKGVPTHSICVDDPKVASHQALKDPTKSRLQIVFFSPGFLSFLECRPEEAYASFRHLDPQSTVALFCCGLREREVMCYHTAPLKSFYSWPKFEASAAEENQQRFSPCFLQMIKDVFPDKSSPEEEIIIVPELINEESTYIYVIFPNAIKNAHDFSVQLESRNSIHIIPESINPYVLQFSVPEILLESCQEFTVKIHKGEMFLAQKLIKIIRDEVTEEKVAQDDFFMRRTSKIIKLDEQLQVLKDIGGSLETLEEDFEEREKTILPSNAEMTQSLKEMCKKYGLEELSALIDEPLMSVTDMCMSGLCVPFNEKDFQTQDTAVEPDAAPVFERNLSVRTLPIDEIDEIDESSGMTRSMSLPAILPPRRESRSGSGDYLPMGFPCIRPRFPHLMRSDALSLSDSNVSSSTYVTMKRGSGRFEAVNKELTKSQEDLLNMMHAFKSGQATLSEVETQFQQWQEKHNPQEGQPLDIEKDDLLQCPVLFSGVSKRPNRKVSDASENRKRFSGSSSQSRPSSSDTWRKFSSTSISSSNSSKNNDANTVQAQQRKMPKNLPHQLSTGWIPSYSTTRITALDAKKDPPPVPISQRPFSKNTMDGITRSKDSTRRKAGTYTPPSLVDLNVVTNQEYKNNDNLDRSLEPLFQICEKYGLGNLSDYFFNELNQDKDISPKIENENDGSPHKKETNQLLNQSCLQLPLSEWDPENTSSLQRSLSLPSTLFPTDVNKAVQDNTEKSPKDMDISKVDLQESAISKCEEYVNSIQSHAYASIQAYISMQTQNKNDSLQANILSASQQELLQIMNAFKRGEKTISQVERQFEDWHTRHMEATSRRDQQLKQLKNLYEKAQKSSTFGIKNFILGKPKNKTSKTSVTTSKTGKRSVAKGDRDSRRLSKVSYTSTSSGMSDNSDVFKNNCYFNPAYGETAQEVCRRNLNTSKVSSSSTEALAPPPPPLPPRPTLTPVFIMKKFTGWMEVSKEEVSDISEPEKSPAKSGSSSPINIIKKKPSPPPKPVNLFKKVSNTSPMESENKQDEKQAEDTRPESPTYIVPNKVIPSSKKKLQSTKSKQGNVTFVEQCPVRYNQLSDKKSVKLAPAAGSSANTNIQDTKIKKKISLKPKQSEDSSSKRQIIPSPWSKLKRPEESKFYVKRRCSSVPDLPSLDLHTEPIYLDLLDLWENRNRSISESNSPAE